MNQPLVKLGQGDHARDGATDGAALLVCACAGFLAIAIVFSLDHHQVSARADTQLTTASGERPCGAATPGAATKSPTTPAGLASRHPAGFHAHQGK